MEHEKISFTALLCARSLAENTNIPYAKEIWNEIEKKGLDEKRTTFRITNFLARFFKGIGLLHSFLEGRYLAANNTIKKLNNPYVIELASGLTPRGLEFSDKNKFYIETDLPGILKTKKEIIEKLNRKIRIFQLNALNKNEFLKIGKIYRASNKKKPLAIIHFGLWTYLTKKEQITLASNIREVLKKYSPKGYWISSDFRPKSLQKNIFFKLFRKDIAKRTKRELTRFRNKEELVKFMNKEGFKVKIIPNKELIKSLNTIKKFKLKKEEVLRQSRNFEVYVMSLK